MLLARRTVAWTVLALALHLAWEIAQLPLYAIWREAGAREIAFAVAHCTAGDGLVSALVFLLTASLLHEPQWVVKRPREGAAITIAASVAYTAFSEWLNVRVLGSWAYSEAMPVVSGIGVAPLAQWIVVPAIAIVALRHLERAGKAKAG